MRKKCFLIFILLLSAVFLLSCTSKPKPNVTSDTNAGSDKLQKSVAKLSQDIDKIYTAQQKYLDTNMELSPPSIKKITEAKQTSENTKQSGSESQGGGSGSMGKSQSQGAGGGQSNQQGSQSPQSGGASAQKTTQKPTQPKISPAQSALVEATSDISKIHKDWSNLEADLVKNGVSMTSVDSFSDDLNGLTTEIKSGEPIRIAYYSNILYKYMPEFMQSAKTKNPTGVYLVIYNLRNLYINAYQNKWQQSNLVLKDLTSEWSSLKMTMKDQSTTNKIDFAVKDLSKAVEKKDKSLVKIKSDILYQDLKPLIKGSGSSE